jgi:hypothetical protein
VDLIGVFPLVESMTEDFTVGQAALKAALSKMAKYKKVF